MCVCFFCDSEQKSSYQCNNVGGFGDNFSLLFFKLLDRSMLLFSMFSILHWRRGIIQQIAFLRVRVVFKTLWECYFSLKRWLFCLYLFVYLSFPKFLNYLIKTGTICWIIWFKELG